jgi:hypothetical protein
MKMKPGFRVVVLILLGLLPVSGHAATGDGLPQDANLLYGGRWDKSTASAPHSYWGGTYVRTGFTGTSLSVKLGKSADIVVYIDSKAAVIKTGANNTVSLATGLAAGNHTVKLVARFASDEIAFQGFVLASGASTLAAEKSKGWIEFIGNSITSGSNTTNGNISAFPWLVGESLNADRAIISYPGTTLVNGYHLNFNGMPAIGMEVQYTKVNTSSLTPATTDPINKSWNFTDYTPDLVVINIGTNDGNGAGVPSTKFQTSYLNFLKLIRGKYPKAQIFALRTFGGYMETQTQTSVTQLVNGGDTRLHYVNTKGWLASSDFASDGLHPTDAGHVKVAAKIVAVLQPYMDSLKTTAIDAGPGIRACASPIRLTKHLTVSVSPDGRNMTRGGSFVKGQILVTTPE